MIENIKLILGLQDDKYDSLITLYIDRYTLLALDHCNRKELNDGLKIFVENKVIGLIDSRIIADENKENNVNTGEIKSVTKGKTRIEYNVAEPTNSNSLGIGKIDLTNNDKALLKRYVKAVMW